MRRDILPYNPELRQFARKLRRNMTLAEVLFWNRIKRGQIRGCDFDRQKPIGNYIVDFYCKDLYLAIEVDGRSHDFKPEQDAHRQVKLEEMGVHFLRFWDQEIKNDMESVLDRIRSWIDENAKPTPPYGHPSKEGNQA